MSDTLDPEQRHRTMSHIRAKNTTPELVVRRFLHGLGFRFRLHVKELPGKPDLVLPQYRTIILVHGCFWHGHQSCKYFRYPKTNLEYWQPKIQKNIARDCLSQIQLEEAGWTVLIVWECELKSDTVGRCTDLATVIDPTKAKRSE